MLRLSTLPPTRCAACSPTRRKQRYARLPRSAGEHDRNPTRATQQTQRLDCGPCESQQEPQNSTARRAARRWLSGPAGGRYVLTFSFRGRIRSVELLKHLSLYNSLHSGGTRPSARARAAVLKYSLVHSALKCRHSRMQHTLAQLVKRRLAALLQQIELQYIYRLSPTPRIAQRL